MATTGSGTGMARVQSGVIFQCQFLWLQGSLHAGAHAFQTGIAHA